ncbi:MAG: hypothetical protein JRF56_03135 [Deltaproteobacteria bacterium]|nr:hypothetical protein [Deltaproteobacteria bacterium]
MNTARLLEGAYDIHLHASPDVIPRAIDLKQLCIEAERAGMAGILLKDHCTSTVGRVAALNLMSSGTCRFYSALALNPPVGSLNPAAVEAALRAGTDVIYFPTYGAAHHISIWGAGKAPTAFPLPENRFKGIIIIDEKNSLKPEAMDILKLIAEHNAILATGHISAQESLILLRKAKELAIERMLVTHASESVPAFTVDQQKKAIELGALVEHSFFAVTPSCPSKISLERMRDTIRQVGVSHVILSSDFGQTANGNPVKNFLHHLEKIAELGFAEQEIRQMICLNPKKMLAQ